MNPRGVADDVLGLDAEIVREPGPRAHRLPSVFIASELLELVETLAQLPPLPLLSSPP
jgi:hypothetical protein